jgi:hypothetical protein
VLETVTNLPAEVIDRVVRPGPAFGLVCAEQGKAATAERVRASDLDTATDLTATPRRDERTQNLVGARDATAAADGATARAARAVRPWEQDFPMPIDQVVASLASATRATAASPTTTPAPGRSQIHSPGRAGPRP